MSSRQSKQSPDDTIRVLSLVTHAEARFYKQQTAVLEDRGISIDTISVPGKNLDGKEIVSRSPSHYLRFFPTVLRHARKNYDLVHANFGLTGPMALAQRRLPVVLSLWGTDVFGKYGWVGKLSARLADEVIVMSEGMAQALPVDSHVIPHGIDLDRFEPMDQREAQKRVGWAPDVKHVLFPYRPGREVKNYPLAERVVEAANSRLDHPVELQTVYGVDHEDVYLYMNAADTLLLPSRWEGSPNSVKEAMACNLPVVVTDVGDVRERLAGVYPSSVCQSEDELIAELVAVLECGQRSNGREAAAEVSLDAMGHHIAGVYESALASSGRQSPELASSRREAEDSRPPLVER